MAMVENEEEGVLLYYKFVPIPEPQALGLWFQSLCSSLHLVGRVRVALDGVNVTIGGMLSSLHKHIDAVKLHPQLGGCDFKLAPAHTTTLSRSAIAPEVGFSSLSVRIVKELVTLGVHPSNSLSVSDAGVHLSAVEFHRKIQEGECIHSSVAEGMNHKELNVLVALAKESNVDGTISVSYESDSNLSQDCSENCMDKGEDNLELIVLDVRNIYETRIGKFVPPKGVEFLDPQIRQYSDLPQWIDSNAEKLQNKNILMYCTGGVRCEMASAYLKKKGKGFQNIFQLSGGIQRYLEAFPDGGFFKGKNFVFDHRVAVPSSCPDIIGTCMKCSVSFDDYSSRNRCSYCRMLVLVCNNCQASSSGEGQPQTQLCELCSVSKPVTSVDHASHLILTSNVSAHQNGAASHGGLKASRNDSGPPVQQKLRILCLHGFRQSASSLKGRLAAFTKKLKGMAEFVFVDAPHEVPLIVTKAEETNHEQEALGCGTEIRKPSKKFAWLVTPEMMLRGVNLQFSSAILNSDTIFSSRDEMGFDKDQYKRQTLGWLPSLRKLEEVFSNLGPFDGVLGFSQGAAVAASLCLPLESILQANSNIKFRFVILCSGFISPANEIQDLMSSVSLPLNCPSLHIFADGTGHDQQVVNDDSVQLKSLFNPGSAMVLTHSLGHIVPSQKEKVGKVKQFLRQFI